MMQKNYKWLKSRTLPRLGMILLVMLTAFTVTKAQDPLLRFPDIHGDQIAFVSGEDIWSVPAEGGVARRLTFNDGEERYPKFSPDGSMIAFTGEYDGNSDVYVMNSNGSDIRRVTFHPGYDEVVGWNAQKNKIMFASNRFSTSRYLKLYLIAPDGTGLEELIMYDAAHGSFSPDGSKIAYNKVSRENRTWKRYTGGLAQEVYIYDFANDTEKNITNFDGTDRLPMWVGDKIYFSSDRDRVLNIYAYDTKSDAITQITHHKDYDIRRPGNDNNSIVYELGGDIWKLDLASGNTAKVPVDIYVDMEETRPYMTDVTDMIRNFDISPSGQRAVIGARGELFSVPKESGITRNLTKSSGARDRDAVWSPDGKYIAWLSDKSGEYQVYIIDPKGNEEAVKLTNFKDGYRHTLKWSPDSKKIGFTDQTLTLYVLDVDSKKVTKVDKAEYENVDVSINLKPIFDFSWSPDSRYIVYSKMNSSYMYQLYVYNLENGDIHGLSDGLFHDFGPVFTKDGKHILFISDRTYDPTYGDIEWEMVYKDVAGIYALTLQADGPPFLPLESDEEGKAAEDKSDAQVQVAFDFDGISNRVEALPLDRGNYRKLSVNETTLFYQNADKGDFNRFEFRAVPSMDLYSYSFADRKQNKLVSGIKGYRLSADGKQIIFEKGKNISIMPAGGTAEGAHQLDLSDLKMMLDPLAEWHQIFNEAWRMERDFYYEPNMHGIDWKHMKEKYGKLIDRATCRQDVQFIIGELIGELNTSHTYVYGGDTRREADRVNIGVLGIDWKADNDRYQITKIFRERDWSRKIYPPLAKPGLDVSEGDYILKVNDSEVSTDKNFYSYFVGLAGQQVQLTVNSQPSLSGAHTITVVPAYSEHGMRYMSWLERNRQKVDEVSDGKIGYVYLPDTYNGSATDFPRYFYSQTKKEGIIVDGRFNGGGLDPEIFLQRLLKKPHGYWTRRYSADQTIPALAVDAYMACLTNRYAGSGGDELPYEFRWHDMGPIIGTRTWGGLVGVSMFIQLIDGGGLTAPDYRIYNREGKWVVENKGITPDIVIDIDSKKMAEGTDTQLMKAVDVLMQKISENPRKWPKHEPYPVDKE